MYRNDAPEYLAGQRRVTRPTRSVLTRPSDPKPLPDTPPISRSTTIWRPDPAILVFFRRVRISTLEFMVLRLGRNIRNRYTQPTAIGEALRIRGFAG